jgi:HTH-type transcriptional regulator/antitoxin HigA
LAKRHAAAFRVSASFAPDPVATEVVIALAYRQAAAISVASYDPELVLESLDRLRELTQSAPARGALEARALLGAAGVALVFLPNVPKSHCNGVTLWGPHGPIVAITDRGRREDIFHELSHVLDGQQDAIYLEGSGSGTGPDRPDAEQRADEFAAQTFVPGAQEHLLAGIQSFDDLARVARELGIGEGVVIGQLHHRGIKPPSWGRSRLAKVVVTA